jgi:hypothetical protein
MSSVDRGILGGQPSITAPTAGPCDSPQVVTRNALPNVLPAIFLSLVGGPPIKIENYTMKFLKILVLLRGDSMKKSTP